MEKLRKLNQVLFTIMSSVIIILVILIIINLLRTFVFKENQIYDKDEMLSKEKVEKILDNDERMEIISFLNIHPVDDSNDLLIIPVTQVSLSEPQKISKMLRIQDIRVPTFPKYRSYSTSYGYYEDNKLLNNLLIYSLNTNSSYPVFDSRICITDFINFLVKDEIYLYIVATDKDSNNDGILNNDDLMDIYIYNISSRKIKKLTQTGEHILNTQRISGTDHVIIKIGIDKNEDGNYSLENEPVTLKTLNVVDHKYLDFIDIDVQQQLQEILDGK